MRKILVMLLVLILVFVGYSIFTQKKKITNNTDVNSSTTSEVPEQKYRLHSFNGQVIPEDQNYILTVTTDSLSIKFCNQMGGNYTITDEGRIQGILVSTQMFCSEPENIMTLESSFGVIIGEGANMSLGEEDSVIIYSADNQTSFAFSPII